MRINRNSVLRIKGNIGLVSDLMYQQNQSEAFSKFLIVINDLSMLSSELFSQDNEDILLNFDHNQLLSTLNEAMNALEKRDDVLLADILNYDLTDLLNELEKQL